MTDITQEAAREALDGLTTGSYNGQSIPKQRTIDYAATLAAYIDQHSRPVTQGAIAEALARMKELLWAVRSRATYTAECDLQDAALATLRTALSDTESLEESA